VVVIRLLLNESWVSLSTAVTSAYVPDTVLLTISPTVTVERKFCPVCINLLVAVEVAVPEFTTPGLYLAPEKEGLSPGLIPPCDGQPSVISRIAS
jgi:hypothetical protein